MSILNKALKGVGWNSLGTVVRSALAVAQLIIFSRILSAQEMGLFVQIGVVWGFISLLSDFGLTAAATSNRDLDSNKLAQLSKGYFINALVVTAVLLVGQNSIVLVFNNPGLSALLVGMSVPAILYALTLPGTMRYQRELEFSTLIKIETVGAILGFMAFCISVYYQFGVMAFVVGLAVNHLAKAVILFRATLQVLSERWDFKLLRQGYGYGLQYSASNIINQLGANADIIFISRFLGAEQAGVYGLVKNLVMKIARIINPVLLRVTMPLYAQLRSSNHLSSIYCLTSELLCFAFIPVYLFFLIFPDLIVSLFFGERWAFLSELLQIFAGLLIIKSVMSQAGSLLNATGRVRRALFWNTMVTFLAATGAYVASHTSIDWVVIYLLVLQILLFLPHWYIQLHRTEGVRLFNYLGAVFRPMVISVAALLISQSFTSPFEGTLMTVIFHVCLAIISFLLVGAYSLRRLYVRIISLNFQDE